MNEINQIGNLGVAAVAVVLFYRLLSNHLTHNTDALNKLKEAIQSLTYYIRDKQH